MPKTWKRIEELFDAASLQAPELRTKFLEEACPDDAELRREVLSLLNSADTASSFLEDPPVQSAEQRPKLQRGYALDHFEILELIGRGGMGDVYRARDLRLKRDVALKVLPADFARNPANVTRFEREARAASALSHPNIVHVYEVGHTDGIYGSPQESDRQQAGMTAEGRGFVDWRSDEKGLDADLGLAGLLRVSDRDS